MARTSEIRFFALITILLSAGVRELDAQGWWVSGPPWARWAAALAFDPRSERMVLFGGRWDPVCFDDTWEWIRGRWVQRVPAVSPPPRTGAAMAFDGARGRLLMFGGSDSDLVARRETWEWSGNTWVRLAPGTTPTVDFGEMVYDRGRRVCVVVGYRVNTPRSVETWEWNGVDWRQAVATLPGPAPVMASLAYDGIRQRVLFGGGNDTGNLATRESWEFDGTTWAAGPPLPVARRGVTLVEDPGRGKVILFGGASDDQAVHNDTWEWDGAAWSQINTPTRPLPRWDAPAVHVPGLGVVLHGGGADAFHGCPHGDTWAYDGRNWRGDLAPRSLTAPVGSFQATYDRQRRTPIVWEYFDAYGVGTSLLWEWNGDAWAVRSGSPAPSTRVDVFLAWHSGSARTVLFGGRSHGGGFNSVALGDTWEWDGTGWMQRHPAHAPQPRSGILMAEDRRRGVLVLLGGAGNGSARFADTWEWDGTDWRQGVAGGPAQQKAMAYDGRRQTMVVFGISSDTLVRETWEFDGITWTLRHATAPSFAGIDNPGMAFDEGRGVCVLHGVVRPSGTMVTQEWDGSTWQIINTPGTVTSALYTLTYDSARQRVMSLGIGASSGLNSSQGRHGTWMYGREDLGPLNQEVRLGQPLRWTLDLPGHAYEVFVCGLSTDSAEGIPASMDPLGNVLVWPLRRTLLFDVSVGIPSLWGALDGAGQGSASVPIPNDPLLEGISLAASAVTLDARVRVGAITRDVRALVVR